MSSNNIVSVILSAGIGSRMNSSIPKVLHKVGGIPMIDHLLRVATKINSSQTIAVISDNTNLKQYLQQEASNVDIVFQQQRLGTGHAVLEAKNAVKYKEGILLVLYGDTPLLQAETINKLCDKIRYNKDAVAIIAFEKHEENQYGKLILNSENQIDKIVEYEDAKNIPEKLTLCNSGVMALDLSSAWDILEQIKPNNNKKEYYLTDCIELAIATGLKCSYLLEDEKWVKGANTKKELADLETIFQNKERERFMDAGVHLIDPQSTYFSVDVEIGLDVTIYPNNYFFPKVKIGNNVVIEPMCVLGGCIIGDNCVVGPFARLRPGTKLQGNNKIGNFVEIKASTIGEQTKVNHLSYIGDSNLGKKVNIGAGTITCNYDGKSKYNTLINDNVFIGSNTSLVAPITIGENAIVGAGSTITENVPDGALGLGRSTQVNILDYKKRRKL